jgi:NAD(P)-dependent dehydrogenase (short-subunit alcohol dehydrogenase family)
MTSDKTVLILGGSSGFGAHLALAFRGSMAVRVTGRRKSNSENYIQHSMNDLNQQFLEDINPDIIINNGFSKSNYVSSYEASLKALKESFKYFKKKGSGKIMNINSISGLIPDPQDPDYAAAKHALKGYSSSITFDAYQSGIQIMDVYPRAIATGMNVGRSDFDDLIDPVELAEFLVSLCTQKSFYVGSIQIDRVR